MPTRSPWRAPVPSVLLPLLALACNNPPPPTTPDLPQVSITVEEPSTVGTSLALSLSVSGCEEVQSVALFDGESQLKTVTYRGNPTPVELARNEVRYTQGIAARLSLTARATCSDGRTNVSQAQPATFFPVEEVFLPERADEQVVPDAFVAEGSGSSTVFFGCGKDANGRSWLYRVPLSGQTQALELPFECTPGTVVTDKHPVSGKRWVWTPNSSAIAVDSQLVKTGEIADPTMRLDALFVGPDGDALVWDEGEGGTAKSYRRYGHASVNHLKWSLNANDTPHLIPGFLISEPRFRDTRTVVLAMKEELYGENRSDILVGTLDFETGQWTSPGFYLLHSIPSLDVQAPPVAFDPTGTLLYMAIQRTGDVSDILACAATSTVQGGRCEGENRKWSTLGVQGTAALVLPYASGSRVAVIAPHQVWFLDEANGQVVNKDSKPLTPNGALVSRMVVPGPGPAFHLFTSAAPSEFQPYPGPVEVIATDAAERGELYRYEVPGGSLSGAVDDSGRLWLRVGRKLVKTLPLEQYRQVR